LFVYRQNTALTLAVQEKNSHYVKKLSKIPIFELKTAIKNEEN